MSQLQVTGEAKIRDIQGPVVANAGVITALDGAASQYVRGDGTLADFPTSTGGGSSVSYYLNGSVNQGTFGGSTYYEMSKSPITGTGTDFAVSANGLVSQFITDANDPALLEVPGGNFNLEFYFSVNNDTGNPFVYAELYKYDGTTNTFTILGSSQSVPEYITQGTTISPYYFAIPVATTSITITDRIAIRIFADVDGRTVTLHTENSHLCQVVTTFSKGLTSLNNLTKQVQYFGIGTSGTNFNIVSSDATHTFNLPDASSSARGLVTTGTQTFGGDKSFSGTTTVTNLNVSSVLTIFGNLSNGTFNYTLPSENGQLALTSQIPSITGTAYQVTRYNLSGTAIEGGSILDTGTSSGSPSGQVTINSRLTTNNYAEVNRYLSVIQNVDSSWALPSTGTSLEAFITSAAGGTLISDTAYLRPRKASDDSLKRFVIQGDDLILNDTTRLTLVNKSGPSQTTTKFEVAGYARFDSNVNLNGSIYFKATDASQPTYISESSGNLTALTTGQITLGTNGTSKFVFDVNGALNLGTSDNSNIININNQFSTLNTTMQGVHITPSIVSASPVIYTGVRSYPQFFLSGVSNYAEIKHFAALNASNTQDNASQIGLYIENLSSIGLAYGIQSLINSGTSRYNLYISGTANNYFKGRIGVDQTNPQYAIDVTGDVNVTGNFKVNGTNLTQGISGGGTQHYIPKYTSATTVGDSAIYQAPASGHVLVNTLTDYSAAGGYLQVGGGFTTESFANIIYGSALYAGNSVYLKLVNGNTIQGTGDRTYFIENRVNTGATSANYYLNYWDGSSTTTRYTLDSDGLHTFNGAATISGTLTGAAATFSSNVGFGTTTGISASVTIYNTSEANQLKIAGAAPAAVYTDSLTSPTHIGVIGLATASNNFLAGASAGEFVIVNQTNKAILFGTGSSTTEKMRLTSGGRLLLGTTTDNGSLLQVAGSATFSGSISVPSSSSAGQGYVYFNYLSSQANSRTWRLANDYNAYGDFKLQQSTTQSGTTFADILAFSSTGAATFSSSVTALGLFTAQGAISSAPSTSGTTINGSAVIKPNDGSNAIIMGAYGTAPYGNWIQSQSTSALGTTFPLILQPIGGNVGIGTSSPSFPNGSGLVVYASDYPRIQLKNSTTGDASTDGAGLFMVGTDYYISNRETGNMIFENGANSERMRILSNGSISMGKTNSVYGTSTRMALELNGSTDSIVALYGGGSLNGYLFGGTANTEWYSTGFAQISTNGAERLRITSSGDVGIGTSSPGVKLEVNGLIRSVPVYNNTTATAANLVVSAGGTFERSTSSLKYKTDVRDYDKGLTELMQIQPKYYKGINNGETIFAGLIAEQIHELGLTEFVQYAEDGSPDALAYTHMMAIVIKSIQELQAKIVTLESKIN